MEYTTDTLWHRNRDHLWLCDWKECVLWGTLSKFYVAESFLRIFPESPKLPGYEKKITTFFKKRRCINVSVTVHITFYSEAANPFTSLYTVSRSILMLSSHPRVDRHSVKFSWGLSIQILYCIGFEVLTALIMKSSMLCDITPYSVIKTNQRLGGIHRLHLQRRRVSQEKC
jgi:hypothetical protein